jgi:hypothetical protein
MPPTPSVNAAITKRTHTHSSYGGIQRRFASTNPKEGLPIGDGQRQGCLTWHKQLEASNINTLSATQVRVVVVRATS